MADYMKKSISFIFLLLTCVNSLEILAGSSRAFLLRTPQFRKAMRRQFSSNISMPKTTSLLSGSKQINSPRFLGNGTTNFFTNKSSSAKWKIPSVIAATLVLLETKHLLTSYSRENEITKAVEKIKNESWAEPQTEELKKITQKFQHTQKGAKKLAEFKTLTKEVIPLYQTFKHDGTEKFIDAIVTKYNNPLGNAFRQSSAYRDMFKKFSPEEKKELLSKVENQKLNKENELKELTTEPGWIWGRRQKTALSPDEKNAIFNLEREIKILNETAKTVADQS
jgi:hypothetical protein